MIVEINTKLANRRGRLSLRASFEWLCKYEMGVGQWGSKSGEAKSVPSSSNIEIHQALWGTLHFPASSLG